MWILIEHGLWSQGVCNPVDKTWYKSIKSKKKKKKAIQTWLVTKPKWEKPNGWVRWNTLGDQRKRSH